MKKLLAVTLLLGIAIAGLFAQRSLLQMAAKKGVISSTDHQAIQGPNIPTTTPTPASTVSIPRTISIPAIGINTAVETVAMDAQGRMDVPRDVNDTAWYSLGARPGEKGSAVIDGHLDTVTGAPAVFWNLKKLQTGDTISVTDMKGQTYTFTITKVINYPYDQVPLQQIFATNDKPRLNLITCGGTWNRAAHNYQERTVVYAEMTNGT